MLLDAETRRRGGRRGDHRASSRGRGVILEGGDPTMANLDWSECPEVESILGKRSGAWAFRGTRTPLSPVLQDLQDMSVDELVEEFGVTREQIHAVLQFAARTAEAPGA